MIIDKYFLLLKKPLIPLCQRKLLTFLITHQNQDLKKSVLHGGGLITA